MNFEICKHHRRGLTMVEVLASMALIGTLLVFILKANADQSRNFASAQQKIKAIGAADRLVASWVSRPEGIPRNATGVCDTKGFLWRVHPTSRATSIPDTEIIELQIIRQPSNGRDLSNSRILTVSLLREVLDEE